MTFTVWSMQPGHASSGTRILHDLLDRIPFTVDVEGPIPRTDYAATCECPEVYRVTEESASWLRRNALMRTLTKRPCVCLCMGSLDEPVINLPTRTFRSHYRKRYARDQD